MSILRHAPLLILLSLAACNKGPEKVAGVPPTAVDPHAGHDHGAMEAGVSGMPNDAVHGGVPSPHGPQTISGEIELLVSGEVELAGDYQGVAEGFVFVSTRDPETDRPGYTTKLTVAAGKMNAAGRQVIPFQLTTGDFFMGAPVGDEFKLKVQYDHDGNVNMGGVTGGTGTVFVPVTRGQKGLHVVIERKD